MLIVCNGMMRSGSTLQYNLARLLVGHDSNGIAHGYIEAKDLKVGILEQWVDSRELHLIKMHELHPSVSKLALEKPAKVKVLYIYRDLRDVAVSAMRVFENKTKMSLYAALDDAIDNDTRIRALGNAIIERYEDFVNNTYGAASRYADLLNLNVAEGEIEEIVKLCSPDNISKKLVEKNEVSKMGALIERIRGLFARQKYDHDPVTLMHENHISSKQDGKEKWKTTNWSLDNLEVQSRYEIWLSDRGYL